MSLTTVSTALIAIVRNVTGYTVKNTSEGDERIFNAGLKKAAILRYGGVKIIKDATPNRYAFHWTIFLDLYFNSRGELKFYNVDILSEVYNIIKEILKYPTLDSTVGVTLVEIQDASDATRWQGELNNWWVVTLPIVIIEKESITLEE